MAKRGGLAKTGVGKDYVDTAIVLTNLRYEGIGFGNTAGVSYVDLVKCLSKLGTEIRRALFVAACRDAGCAGSF